MKQLKSLQIADGSALVADVSYPFTADFHEVASVHIIWTSTTAAATATLQFSNDGVTWENFAAAQAIANNSGAVFHKVKGIADALYWRVLLDWSSGSVTTFKAYLAYLLR